METSLNQSEIEISDSDLIIANTFEITSFYIYEIMKTSQFGSLKLDLLKKLYLRETNVSIFRNLTNLILIYYILN